MKKEEIKELLKPLNKKDLKTVIQIAEKQLNASLGIGDKVTFIIYYMIGDADGDTEESFSFKIESQDDLAALDIIQDILNKHTEPNKGHWGFSLNKENFGKKPDDVYNILYNQEDAPSKYNGVKITPKVLERINEIVEESFSSDTEYSFLTYEGCELKQ